MLRRTLLLLPAALLLGPMAHACGCEEDVGLGKITAQLFYRDSGKLSDDLLARKEPFVGWNTIIGEGDAEGPAEDLLVTVALGGKEEAFLDEKLELWVTDEGDGEIARRDFQGILVPYEGETVHPLWLEDVGCAGLLVFHAKFRGEEKSAYLRLDCGE